MSTKRGQESGIAYFLREYREARRLLDAGETFHWGGWRGAWPGTQIETAEQFHACIQRGLDRKINAHGGLLREREKWRKWSDDYYWQCCRDQRAIRARVTRRVIVTRFETKEARRRFSQLLTDPRTLV